MTDPQIEPLFYPDGDTKIVFPWGVYRLHSTVLSLSSEYIRGLFTWPASKTDELGSRDGATEWTLVLGEEEFLTFSSEKYPLPKLGESFDVSLARSFDSMLRSFYNMDIRIPWDTVDAVVKLAEKYLALEAIRQSTIVLLLDCNLEPTIKAITQHPVRYLALGYSLRCGVIFREAFVHCVGTYKRIFEQGEFQTTSIPTCVQKAVEDEYWRLYELRTDIFIKVAGLDTSFRKGNDKMLHEPEHIMISIHRALQWYCKQQSKPGSFEGQYAGFLARIFHQWSLPADHGGTPFQFKKPASALIGTLETEVAVVAALVKPLVGHTRWSNITRATPYLLCARVDMSLIDRKEG